MPKYWGKQIFTYGRFPKVGQKQTTEKERERERLNDGNNNGQLRLANAILGGACKATWAKIFHTWPVCYGLPCLIAPLIICRDTQVLILLVLVVLTPTFGLSGSIFGINYKEL